MAEIEALEDEGRSSQEGQSNLDIFAEPQNDLADSLIVDLGVASELTRGSSGMSFEKNGFRTN